MCGVVGRKIRCRGWGFIVDFSCVFEVFEILFLMEKIGVFMGFFIKLEFRIKG